MTLQQSGLQRPSLHFITIASAFLEYFVEFCGGVTHMIPRPQSSQGLLSTREPLECFNIGDWGKVGFSEATQIAELVGAHQGVDCCVTACSCNKRASVGRNNSTQDKDNLAPCAPRGPDLDTFSKSNAGRFWHPMNGNIGSCGQVSAIGTTEIAGLVDMGVIRRAQVED